MQPARSEVLTLIAGPGAEQVLPGIAAPLARELNAEPDWLAPGRACDLALHLADPRAAEGIARRVIGAAPIDVLVQPVDGRRKRVFVADLESTIIENEMLDELAEFVGLREHVAEITRRTMNGEIDFAASLAERVALLQGLPASVLDEAAARIRLIPGAGSLVATLHAAGVTTALVSGGFTVFAEPVALQLGFDRVVANRLDMMDGHIVGTIAPPIATGDTKRDALVALAQECSVPLSNTCAVGDGANDLPMLEAAGLGIAFHAKPAVAVASRRRIDHADLMALLYAQGYRQQDIVG